MQAISITSYFSEEGVVPNQSLQGFKADLFKALAHPARIRILELLRSGEMTVTELSNRLNIESSSISQQLAVLRFKNIVGGRKDGTSVYYCIQEPRVCDLLDIARDIFTNHLGELQAMVETETAASESVNSAPTSSGRIVA